MSLEEYMTTEEVAQALGISKRGVQKLIERNLLAAERVGRIYLIRREVFAAYKPRRPGRPKE